ncbi:MAG: hypothetical protein Q9M19_06960 [Mariprofundaceae bacterium]|nr:hypothetical protein [Mariprofundaceae bacterium]
MSESDLFRISKDDQKIDIFLGTFPCDIPFSPDKMDSVNALLTRNSDKSEHGIPVLRLYVDLYQMDFEAHEHTPIGHAAKVIADWLNQQSELDETTRYVVELFLWRWPGIRQDENGLWSLSNKHQRVAVFKPPFINFQSQIVQLDVENTETQQRVLDNSNLQVHDTGFCMKDEPCYLLDACLMCPHFCTNIHFEASLQKRLQKLEDKRDSAVESNNPRLAEVCHQALKHLNQMIAVLQQSK